MKCHDMKHQLLSLSQKETRVSDETYTRETLDFIKIYDSFFKTGNKYLDLILTEKNLVSERKNCPDLYG